MKYKIVMYKRNGKSDIEEYIEKLKKSGSKDSRIKLNKIREYLRLLMENGLELREPYIKHLEDEIWELRPLRDRILFAAKYGDTFVLLSIFVKKTQKTPKKEIEKAIKNLKNYEKER